MPTRLQSLGSLPPFVAGLVATGLAIACGSDDAERREPGAGTATLAGAGGSGGSSGATGGFGGASGGNGGASGGSSGASGGAVPTTPAALFPWLQSKAYSAYPAESKIHPSAGPHGGSVRAYLSPSLLASLTSGGGEHPEGAAVVKELYGPGATLKGWAVAVKTQPSSAAGAGWYWFEVFSTTSPVGALEGQGKSLCVDCHKVGTDFVLSPFPLQLSERARVHAAARAGAGRWRWR